MIIGSGPHTLLPADPGGGKLATNGPSPLPGLASALLTAIVERESLMRNEMMRMHRGMMARPMEHAAPAAWPDEEPGAMCVPSP